MYGFCLTPPEPTGEPVNGHDFDSGKGECSVCGRKGYARCMAMGCIAELNTTEAPK
jgi:hypothetical protein